MHEELRLHVDEGMQGQRIDRLLAERFPEITRAKFQKLLRDGHVTARGRRVRSAYRTLVGDDILVVVPPTPPMDLEPENIPLEIVYEDDGLLIVDKPAGLVVHPAAGNATGTLVHALLYHRPALAGGADAARPGIVHRLDKDTSGLMVVAKSERLHAVLSGMLQRREVRREYAALVWGLLAADAGVIEGDIGRHPTQRKKMAVTERGGKPARTRFRVRERFEFTTLLDVALDSGRTHQIRVHMGASGHPVFGDATYGGRNSRLTRLPAGLRVKARQGLNCISRQALHAMRLSFCHPETQRELVFESRLPEDFEATLATMRRPAPGVHP